MHLETTIFRILHSKNYEDQFKLLWVIEENLDIFYTHGSHYNAQPFRQPYVADENGNNSNNN